MMGFEQRAENPRPQAAFCPDERRLHILINALPVLIGYVDREERYHFTNKTHQDWFDYSPAQIAGMAISELLGEATYQTLRPYIRLALSGQQVNFETVVAFPKHGERHICAFYVPDIVDQGEVQGFFCVVNDITERKRAEQQQRTRLKEVAQAARLSAMGELVRQIAHEVNQPLSAIASYCGAGIRMVESGTAGALEIIEILRDIATQAQRAGNIIREMRRLVHKRAPRFAAIDINKLVSEILHLVQMESSGRAISVRVDADPTEPRVLGDKVLIEQVVLNLLRNALEAMEGKPLEERCLTVRTWKNSDQEVEVLIQDNGTGLPAEAASQIFEPFFTTKSGGMGMGLSISRSIVEMHRGRLWATANPEGGASFHLALPSSYETVLSSGV
jgi:PAS domain S-box-containing protein